MRRATRQSIRRWRRRSKRVWEETACGREGGVVQRLRRVCRVMQSAVAAAATATLHGCAERAANHVYEFGGGVA